MSGFLIDKTQVTWRQFEPFAKATGTPQLPAEERAEFAMALWESLTDAEHLKNPGSAMPWHEVRRKLRAGA